jgi:hypothetical protein
MSKATGTGFLVSDGWWRACRWLAPVAALLGGLSCASRADEVGALELTSDASEAITEASGSAYLETGSNTPKAWDDIWAESDNRVAQSAPSTVFATEPTITLTNYTGSTQNYAYFRFIVDNFSAQPTQALIWLYVEEGEPAVQTEGLKLRVTTEAWTQGLLTYTNAPGVMDGGVGIGPVLTKADFTNKPIPDGLFGSGANVGVSGWQAIDVSSVVKGNGVYSFRLAWSGATSGSNHGVTFRTMNYRVQGSPDDLNHQCNGLPCVRLQVTGARNPRTSTCPTRVTAPTQYGTLPSASPAKLDQDSGLVASAKYANYYYTHNDRSNQSSPGKFYLIGPLATGTGTPAHAYAYTLPGGFWQSVSDTEEIQIGPGPKVNTSYVYLGDIGDNNQSRDYIQILRVEEPGQSDATVTGQILKVKYPPDYYATGQPQLRLNSEAFIIDPVDGSLYVIEKPCNGKGEPGYNRIFSLALTPSFFGDGLVHELAWNVLGIETGGFPNTDNFSTSCSDQTVATAGQRATGAAINRTGTAIAVTFYGQNKFWWLQHRGDPYYGGGGPEYTLNINAPAQYGWECDITATSPGTSDIDTKREAISFTRDLVNTGVHFFTTGEGSAHKIWRY